MEMVRSLAKFTWHLSRGSLCSKIAQAPTLWQLPKILLCRLTPGASTSRVSHYRHQLRSVQHLALYKEQWQQLEAY